MAVLYRGMSGNSVLPGGIDPVFTAAIASNCFCKTGVFPFDPQRIDRTHLRKTLEMPPRSQHEDELMRDGPAVVCSRRITAPNTTEQTILELRIERDTEKRKRVELEEELEYYRSMVVAQGKDNTHKEVKGEFGPGLCTSDEIHAKLVETAKKKEAEQEERKKKAGCRPDYVTNFKPAQWRLVELKEQCHLHGVVINGMTLRKDIWAAYVSKFPQSKSKSPPTSKVPATSDSESETESENESESDRSEINI